MNQEDREYSQCSGCAYHRENGGWCSTRVPGKHNLKCFDIQKKKFVLLEGIETDNKFFSLNTPERDPRCSANGELWYNIIGYADTVEEAQIKLYGRVFK